MSPTSGRRNVDTITALGGFIILLGWLTLVARGSPNPPPRTTLGDQGAAAHLECPDDCAAGRDPAERATTRGITPPVAPNTCPHCHAVLRHTDPAQQGPDLNSIGNQMSSGGWGVTRAVYDPAFLLIILVVLFVRAA